MKTALAVTLAALMCASASAGRVWWDGSTDDADSPPGKLLSDNDGYWGEQVLTGVEYTYETEPTNPADIWKNDKDRYGRRLLDGRPSGNWWVPVGVNGMPVVPIFDFKRQCVFSEVDISTRSKKVAVIIQCRAFEEDEWLTVLERSLEDSPEQLFHRFPLPENVAGRYLRVSVEAPGISWLEEVIVWGDGEVSEEAPEYLQPTVPTPVATEIAFSSIAGIDKTTFSDAQFWAWQRALGNMGAEPVVWSRVPEWDSLTHRPILPEPDAIIEDVDIVMARNETECVALALTNTSCTKPAALELALGRFLPADQRGHAMADLSGTIRVAGAIASRHYGVNIGPLLEPGNLPGGSLMRKFLTNGAEISELPRLSVHPAGSAVLWLSVTTHGAEPGLYEAKLSSGTGLPLSVRVRVLNVTLPAPPVWLNTWSGITSMFPFEYADRPDREVAYKQSLGITVWNGLPEPGTVAAVARERGRTIHHVYAMPRKYVDLGYAGRVEPGGLSEEDQKAIADHARELVAKATGLGLGPEDWFGELWDEPGQKNSLLYGDMCRIIKQAAPAMRLFCNPCFWVGNGVQGDEEVHEVLAPWYREMVDISVPLYLLLNDRPKCFALFDSPRAVNAFYTVNTQSAKGERAPQVQLYRRQAWDAFRRGWNGWGFYSYYGPRGNPWNDLDASWGEDRPDYLMIYPGPRGPIPTRQSESVREGWEDYCLLTLLRNQGRTDVLTQALQAYQAGAEPHSLRPRLLEAATGER